MFVPSVLSLLRALSVAAGAVVILVGCLVLVGWIFNVNLFKRLVPAAVAMNPTTAVAFVLAGVSLWLLLSRRVNEINRRIARVFASVVALVGLAKLVQVLLGWEFGVDQLLFPERLESGAEVTGLPDRMALNTALNFLLVGCALLLLDKRTRRGRWPAQYLALAAAVMALLAVTGYAYRVESIYSVTSYISMALHTALTFVVLSIGILCARPERGLMVPITSDSMGGVVTRRLLPAPPHQSCEYNYGNHGDQGYPESGVVKTSSLTL